MIALLFVALLLPRFVGTHDPTCPHHEALPLGEASPGSAHAAHHGPAPSGPVDEAGPPSSDAACTCVGACHAGNPPIAIPGTPVVAAAPARASAPSAAASDDLLPPAAAYLLPYANGPPAPPLA